MKLLHNLIDVHAPSGSEHKMNEFLVHYVKKECKNWKVEPKILHGDNFQDALILVFGKPSTAIFAHMDTVGFTARYENQLVAIGGPSTENGLKLTGEDQLGPIECQLNVDDNNALSHDFARAIERGTTLTFKPSLKVTKDYLKGTFLDNRLGMYSALKVAESLENGVIVFSCFEEHGGGNVPLLIKYLYEQYKIKQALISDITWVTDGVSHGNGVVISLRDRNIPRKKFIDRIVTLAAESGIPCQLEVEGSGSSDGREIHHSPYPIDWCFIGAPESNVHSPNETVYLSDLYAMINMYQYLMKKL